MDLHSGTLRTSDPGPTPTPAVEPRTVACGALRAFLLAPDLVDASGEVRSWVGPGAFGYPEAAGIWLAWAAWRAGRGDALVPAVLATAVAERLERDLRAGPGVGKAGRTYVFDTAIAWVGCLAAARARLAPAPAPGTRAAVLRALEQGTRAPAPLLPGPSDPLRWSQRWGAYQRRAAALLHRAALQTGDADLEAAAGQIRRRIGSVENGRPPYVHAWCYAMEARAMEGCELSLQELDALAALQRPDGGIPAWVQGGAAHADSTAQALRLWRAAPEPLRYALPVAHARTFLAARQAPSGGLRYADDLPHQPTWAACFADQALAGSAVPASEWV